MKTEKQEIELAEGIIGTPLLLERENLKSDEDCILFDKQQVPTAAENFFKVKLVHHLVSIKYEGDLCHNEYLVIKVSSVRRFLKKQNLSNFNNLIPKNRYFVIKRPDFYSPKYGFCIEIDGSCHDKLPHKQKSDELRDLIYKSIGIEPFRIGNDEVFNPRLRNRFIQDILKFIENQRANPDLRRQDSARGKKISIATSAYRKTENRKINIGRYSRFHKVRQDYPGLRVTTHVQNGGYRLSFHQSKLKNKI